MALDNFFEILKFFCNVSCKASYICLSDTKIFNSKNPKFGKKRDNLKLGTK